ncbi:uncharacterized protein Z518_08002 [Rhinocladiella mackenziei CBS 650.93]|uniref:Luciferase domain-containing protein n=1 Tax=Rhinocladiella mackenziei CBS 650.93 TaxID=1442369 RepID=A0A0D2GUX4_9EURO|nr:uncharacterized protein Z518_08002 [Rhinocladiella mackenziei CBS 650.93]KIX02063.1 hypothetical protein Z518_08002 [Rhinocladiella mackenziei CBS 650.93]
MDLYTLPNITEPQPTASFLSLPSILFFISLTVFLVGLVHWCIQDYRLFKALGPGGPPYNVFGWIKVSIIIRPFTLADHETTRTEDYPDAGAHEEILALPERKGERPVIVGIAPQRQFSQCPGPEMNTRVLSLFSSAVTNNPKLLQKRVSGVEKHHSALFVHPSLLSKPENLSDTARISNGELGHIHGDTSLHLYFSPPDARVIIEKGWAQRHRLARTQPWWFGGGKNWWQIGETFLLIYAPRNEYEVDVLRTLIRASARFMTGEEGLVEP